MPRHPQQPIVLVDGVRRFKQNKIVRLLVNFCRDGKKVDLNDIWLMGFSNEDMRQLYQLIGYSVSGYMDVFDDGADEDFEAVE